MWRPPARKDKEAASACHEAVVVETRELHADQTAGGSVEEEVFALVAHGLIVKHDPAPQAEARIRRAGLGVVGARAPATADCAHAHVVVQVVGGKEAVADAANEVGRE